MLSGRGGPAFCRSAPCWSPGSLSQRPRVEDIRRYRGRSMGDPRRPKVDQEEPRGLAPSSCTLHAADAELRGGGDLLNGSQPSAGYGSRGRSFCPLHTAEPCISYLVPSFPDVTLPLNSPQSLPPVVSSTREGATQCLCKDHRDGGCSQWTERAERWGNGATLCRQGSLWREVPGTGLPPVLALGAGFLTLHAF